MTTAAAIAQRGGARISGADAGPAPLVSVVTATLNAVEGLKQTVASVREQDFPRVEHVIVDGGSIDGTVEYLKGQGHGLAFWISEPDHGIADAMNKGVAAARGDYFLVLQAGDTFATPGSLRTAAVELERGGDVIAFDVLVGSKRSEKRLRPTSFIRRIGLKPICHQGVFCRRDLFGRVGDFDTSFRVCMDYEFFLRARRRGASLRCVPEILSRMPDTGISSQLDWPSLEVRFAEERRAQRLHCRSAAWRAFDGLYWPAYLAYRRGRSALSGSPRFESSA